LTNSGTSSARLYWESFSNFDLGQVTIPAAATIFPREIMQPSQRWMATRFTDIRYFRRAETGGHFAAMQVPELFVAEVRSGLRDMEL
jgi:epoxide hydrolase